jgi:NAD(P)-dependent dehydrogenase (short-subunit alcohol dehydrogenase family)
MNNASTIITNSTWFITGIGCGLGRCIALEVLRRGARVAGTVRNLAHVSDLQQQFPNHFWAGELDLADLANIATVFQAASDHFGGTINAVVSNAGYSLLGAAEELEPAQMRHIIDTNLLGSIELARVAVAHMRQNPGGKRRLIQISSGAGQCGFPGLSLYCATKWGIEGFYEALAPEIAPFGIHATLVEPGTIRTGFGSSGVLGREIEAYREGPAWMMRRAAETGYTAPGDPAKMAKVIVDTFEMPTPPMRLTLGPDVYGYIQTALTTRLQQLEACKAVTMSTDCDPEEVTLGQ